MGQDKAKYEENLRSMRAMMRFHDVPEALSGRVEQYFEYKFQTKTMFDDMQLYDALPVRLRSDLVLHRYQGIVSAIPFFRGCHEDAILDIVAHFKTFSVLPLDYLFREGDPSVELVVLTKGRLAVVDEDPGAQDGQDTVCALLAAAPPPPPTPSCG